MKCEAELEIDLAEEAIICERCGSPLVARRARDYYNNVDNSSFEFEIDKGTLKNCKVESDEVTIPEEVRFIGPRVFQNSGITKVIMHEGIIGIGLGAFENCIGITTITIPDSVEIIGDAAFRGCKRLTSIKIGGKLTEIGEYAFKNCENLANVTIPDSVGDIDSSVFEGCNKLTEAFIGMVENSPNDKIQKMAIELLYKKGELSKLSLEQLLDITKNTRDSNIGVAAVREMKDKFINKEQKLKLFEIARSTHLSLIREEAIELLIQEELLNENSLISIAKKDKEYSSGLRIRAIEKITEPSDIRDIEQWFIKDCGKREQCYKNPKYAYLRHRRNGIGNRIENENIECSCSDISFKNALHNRKMKLLEQKGIPGVLLAVGTKLFDEWYNAR